MRQINDDMEPKGTTGQQGKFVEEKENVAIDPQGKGNRKSSRKTFPHKRWELYQPF